MSDLFWPGDDRAGELFTDRAFLEAMVRTEAAWLSALVAVGVAPAGALHPLDGLAGPEDVDGLARSSQDGGNPVIPLVRLLRERLSTTNATAAEWVHRGLTSQDVLDTGLMLCARDTLEHLRAELVTQVAALSTLVDRHRSTRMVGRTLTQHAVPITFGLKAAGWLTGVLDALDTLDAVEPRAQIGGAAGTMAAPTALAATAGLPGPARCAIELAEHTARTLGLPMAPPWHTSRAPITRIGDALAGCTDAWGRIAADVLTLSRPEIGELAEGTGGGSSTMPHKANPVLSVLIRRAALTAPGLAAQLHLAATEARDERPDGAWHLEWATLRDLVRRTATAANQTTSLLVDLRVRPDRMRATFDAAAEDLLAEARAVGARTHDPADYLGANDVIIGAVLDRARSTTKERE